MSAVTPPAALHPPSAWLQRWAHLIAPGGRVLDLACGPGRHAYWLHAQGFAVTAVDRAPEALASLVPLATAGAEVLQAELEAGPWPLAGRQFDAVVVTNYLWRPRLAEVLAAVGPGGVLIYETFALGNESVGRPSRPDSCCGRANCCRPRPACAWSPTRMGSWTLRHASCSASPPYGKAPRNSRRATGSEPLPAKTGWVECAFFRSRPRT